MTRVLSLIGAGGKMGLRITEALADDPAYDVRHVEPAPKGRENLRDRGADPVPIDEALEGADLVVLAVPDDVIGPVCEEVAAAGEDLLVLLLDPAAAHAGALPDAPHLSVAVAHPCHPSLFPSEPVDWDARSGDYFGGEASQSVVCALHDGNEGDYERAAALARDVYAPVDTVYRLTTAQMAVLEPALVETLTATLLTAMRRGLERAVEMGVPEDAAREFLYGHLRTEAAIVFDEAPFPLSDAAQAAVADATDEVLVEDWVDRVFDPAAIEAQTERIATDD